MNRPLAWLLGLLLTACSPTGEQVRERSSWNDDWKFALSDSVQDYSSPDSDDSTWRILSLPHDWSIEGDFSLDNPSTPGGGALPGGIGWYRKTFTLPETDRGKVVYVDFDGVYRNSEVWINGHSLGFRPNGYVSFRYDLTPYLRYGSQPNVIVVKADNSEQPNSRWYSGSGIYRNVWLVKVNPVHVDNWGTFVHDMRISPEEATFSLEVRIRNSSEADREAEVSTSIYDDRNRVVTAPVTTLLRVPYTPCYDACMREASVDHQFSIPNPKLWSPDSPFLYTLKVTLKSGDKVLDKVDSYAAMRKYSTRRDANGIVRLELNNEALFQFGPLDQGWWPDGLYTAPTDEALLYDVRKTKDFGFNMIRKHIKVEPARWYTHCDQLGIIVWQDMPSGDRNPEWQNHRYFDGTEMKRSAESEACYRKEWKEIMDCLYSYPCIGTWVPFNEAWGQFKTPEIVEWTKQYDPTRLVNPASGGNHYTCGDMLDLHNYPQPEMYLYDAQRATVLGEYGGIGLVLEDHIWEPNRNWGYVQFNSSKEVTDEYVKYADMLYQLIDRGFSAAVYTQTTDVEVEVNGLMTYDRKVIKLDEARVREANKRICNALKK